MHLYFDNVNEAFETLVTALDSGELPTRRTTSRNGDALVIDEPVTITYTNPRRRVLFNPARDCNPFFHLFESLWMLAGRRNVDSLRYYAKQIAEYSDDGRSLNGAYGFRWREAFAGVAWDMEEAIHKDQLTILINHLKEKPDSRRAVLQMWNVEDDLMRIDNQDHNFSKDVCCNLSVCFLIRHSSSLPGSCVPYLDMTVFNRSNDLIWGSLGANVVHFSFLQEYMANCLGVEVGVYHQISNNLHTYLNNWKPTEWLAASAEMDVPDYATNYQPEISLVMDREAFDYEVGYFINNHAREDSVEVPYSEPFLAKVALPMCMAFANHKKRNYDEAFKYIRKVACSDWALAGEAWLKRRMEKWAAKQAKPKEDRNIYQVMQDRRDQEAT